MKGIGRRSAAALQQYPSVVPAVDILPSLGLGRRLRGKDGDSSMQRRC
jgi:hypothetical protein